LSTRFAIVGCGTAARHIHLPALRAAGADVTVFASRSRASAEHTRDAWGSGEVVDDWHSAVTRDDVDAVLIATPNAQHSDVAVAAMDAHKHVLTDKPMACTVAACDAMITAAEHYEVVLVPFQNTRFVAPFVAAHDTIAQGRIGTVTGVRAAFGHGGPQDWAPDATWFFDRDLAGGGCLIDLGVHVIDLVRYVTGLEITGVAALLQRQPSEVEKDAQLLVELSSGATGTIQASWSSRSGPDHQLTVIGTDGTLHLDARTPLTLFPVGSERERVALPDDTSSPLIEFIAAVNGERAPSVTAHDGRAAVAVVEAAYFSAAADSSLVGVT
jgi:predicted dehydrogenase